jgi:hypothetical protein
MRSTNNWQDNPQSRPSNPATKAKNWTSPDFLENIEFRHEGRTHLHLGNMVTTILLMNVPDH